MSNLFKMVIQWNTISKKLLVFHLSLTLVALGRVVCKNYSGKRIQWPQKLINWVQSLKNTINLLQLPLVAS